jgi:hypothetical protein
MQARLRSRKTVASSFATRPGCRGRTNYYKVITGNRLSVTLATDGTIVTLWKGPYDAICRFA